VRYTELSPQGSKISGKIDCILMFEYLDQSLTPAS
jgi:hypothetical protein